jgi:hypothetical protein
MVSKGEKESAENRLSSKRPTSTRAFLKASGLFGESRDGSLSLKVREDLHHHWSTHIPGDPLSLDQCKRCLKSGRKSRL